jgi:WD40 repeat protein
VSDPVVPTTAAAIRWQDELNEYITSIVVASDGSYVAASSVAGEIAIWESSVRIVDFQLSTGGSIDAMAISADDRYLAAGGSDGEIFLWRRGDATLQGVKIAPRGGWIDRLAWHPTEPLLALNGGKNVLLWDAILGETIAVLAFRDSSIFGLAWHPSGEFLAAAGKGGVKIWQKEDWQAEPVPLHTPAATNTIAFSPTGDYLAAGNLDGTIVLLEWANPDPWIMKGFASKVRHLFWSSSSTGIPILITASAETTIFWTLAGETWDGVPFQLSGSGNRGIECISIDSLILASANGTICRSDRQGNIKEISSIELEITSLCRDGINNCFFLGDRQGTIVKVEPNLATF